MPADSKKIRYRKPSFFENFVELHRVMWKSNNGLKSSHPYDSRPGIFYRFFNLLDSWPLMARGIGFWRSKDRKKGIFLLGNPIVWIPAYLAIFSFLGYVIVDFILERRQIVFKRSGYFKDMIAACWFFLIGFFIHYLPFFLMNRKVCICLA